MFFLRRRTRRRLGFSGLGDVLEHALRHHRGHRGRVRALCRLLCALTDTGIRLVAIAAILLLSGINYLGVKQGSALQTIFTLGKVIAIVAILVLVVVLRSPGMAGANPTVVEQISVAKFALAVAAASSRSAVGTW